MKNLPQPQKEHTNRAPPLFAPIAAALVLLVVGTLAMLRFLTSEAPIDEPTKISAPAIQNLPSSVWAWIVEPPKTSAPANQVDKPPETSVPANQDLPSSGWTWIVEPTLNYEWFRYCCDVFFYSKNGKHIIIDEKTGKKTNKKHDNHPVDDKAEGMWVYDPQLELMGFFFQGIFSYDGKEIFDIFPVNEFNERFPKFVDLKIVVHHIDSTMYGLPNFAYPEFDGFTGEVEMTFGNNFIVTDFKIRGSNNDRLIPSIASIAKNIEGGQWKFGVINKNSEILVPLIFDEVWIIDKNTAFAKLNGKLGIIGFVETES